MGEKRVPFRADHIKLAEKFVASNELVAAGAFVPNLDGALFIFKGATAEDVIASINRFVQEDPYCREGLTVTYSWKEWSVAIGRGTLDI
eukprot:CAMPEP_0170071548 /NCGR_PEP_ID=MMETSP0019_2-20121128/9441_1 /TAXON_ID=98059 /ORGANISM="Dinobryon sp., Strain UTEXLB2267" /LENGTH=88 /DNA_ID=CAMNT_0010280139 /DNA_START=290 /DNA_END=556 /DNA_ORIENTATION=-